MKLLTSPDFKVNNKDIWDKTQYYCAMKVVCNILIKVQCSPDVGAMYIFSVVNCGQW